MSEWIPVSERLPEDEGLDPEYAWIYRTEIPHACFDILENGEKYCKGIVFSLNDL